MNHLLRRPLLHSEQLLLSVSPAWSRWKTNGAVRALCLYQPCPFFVTLVLSWLTGSPLHCQIVRISKDNIVAEAEGADLAVRLYDAYRSAAPREWCHATTIYIYIYGLGACSGPPRFGESGKMLLSYSLSGRSIWGARKTHRVIYIINLKDQ